MGKIARRNLGPGFSTALTGPARDYAESSSSLAFAFLFALALIYLVLAAQFESFKDPLIIMFTVPLAVAGAFLSLWYFDQSLNIFGEIGIIMLIGLVTKNGILIVEFGNQRKEHGLSVRDAIVESAAVAIPSYRNDQPHGHPGQLAHRLGPGGGGQKPDVHGHRGDRGI